MYAQICTILYISDQTGILSFSVIINIYRRNSYLQFPISTSFLHKLSPKLMIALILYVLNYIPKLIGIPHSYCPHHIDNHPLVVSSPY
jgi:hypothetical protein